MQEHVPQQQPVPHYVVEYDPTLQNLQDPAVRNLAIDVALRLMDPQRVRHAPSRQSISG